MKIWTYGEMKAKVLQDLSMEEESFVDQDELVGYANDAIDVAEAEIHMMHQDYFRKSTWIPLVQGQANYAMPSDLYANKIRGMTYQNGNIVYPVTRIIEDENTFVRIVEINQLEPNADYQYYIENVSADVDRQIVLVPPSRETGSNILKMWYIRNANRVPLSTEYVSYDTIGATDPTTDTINITQTYSTGDRLKFTTTGSLPAPLAPNTVYYAIRLGPVSIKLATTLANAVAGVPIDITDSGSGVHSITIGVNDTVQSAVKIDIPEFSNFVMMYMKVMCLGKTPGDPRLDTHVVGMEAQRKLMVDTLTQMVPDNRDQVPPDFTHYNQSS